MTSPKIRAKFSKRIHWLVPLIFLLALTLLYGFPLDATYALWAWPASIGLTFGLIATVFAKSHRRFLAAGWLAFALLFVDETRSIPRMVLPTPKADFRVVTLNCAGGSLAAAREVIALKPDLVLFQESPSKSDIEQIARELYGEQGAFVHGTDASIVARGELAAAALPRGTGNFMAAKWTAPGAEPHYVVSLRLAPPAMRLDLFNPDAWRAFRENRAARRAEVAEIGEALTKMEFDPDIIGGDFNTPPDRKTLMPLISRYGDSFANTGRGYGATCVNPMPCIVRIDQIWYRETVKAVKSWVEKTQESDHRMLVSEFVRK